MNPLKILMVSSEAAPFARTGGLGDVLAALPKALARQGHEVKTVIPRYSQIDFSKHKLTAANWSVRITTGAVNQTGMVSSCRDRRNRDEIYFVGNEKYFDRPGMYIDPTTDGEYPDNDERFLFLSLAALEIVRNLGWKPDIIHCHDWQTALIPVYLKTGFADDDFFRNTRTVLTIHNLGYQGVFEPDRYGRLGLPPELMYSMTGPLEFYGKINFLKAGIILADAVSTVSATYAKEIQSSEFGAGLEGVLQNRSRDLRGIINGVDYTVWSPTRDKFIPYRFNPANLTGKRENKVVLLNRTELPLRDKVPLVGIISRLADQKGFDLIAQGAEKIFKMDLQMVLLGTGEEKYHTLFTQLEERYPDKLKVYLKFDDELAHLIEAAADIFLMPSKYEPCGLNQMYSLKYGTVPVVRKVGGLADTVEDYNPDTGQGTGFVFEDYTSDALVVTLERAVSAYKKKKKWTKLMKADMKKDFSWDYAAVRYSEFFEDILS